MSKPAAQYRWPENGKNDLPLPYDTGNAISDVPLPVNVQCPDGGARTLGPSDLNQNLVTASPIPIAGANGGPPPPNANSAYTGTDVDVSPYPVLVPYQDLPVCHL